MLQIILFLYYIMIQLLQNPTIRIALILTMVGMVGWYLYMQWVELLKKQKKDAN